MSLTDSEKTLVREAIENYPAGIPSHHWFKERLDGGMITSSVGFRKKGREWCAEHG